MNKDGRSISVGRAAEVVRIAAFLVCSVLASAVSHAGGSGEEVTIERFDVHGDDYTLVVIPKRSEWPDPYMGECERFEVRGTYQRLRGEYFWLAVAISREEHRRALAYMQHAFVTKQHVHFGWIGTGFVAIDAANPCVVRSRALSVLETGEHTTWVVSYHDRF